MSDLKLVAPHEPTALERQLLNAATNESPSAEQRLRVRLALGLPAFAPTAAPVAQAGRRALVLKGAAGALIVMSAALLWFSGIGRTPELHPVLDTSSIAVPSAASLPEQSLRAPEALVQPVPAIVPSVDAASDTKRVTQQAARSAAAAPPSASGEDLSEQLRLIDAARTAVATGNATSASAAIASYTSRFPRGIFGQEAAVLRIETVDLQGNHAQAAALARSFLARHPNSPHVNVVQRIASRAQ